MTDIQKTRQQTGFVKECVQCGCHYADTVSPVPPRHISEILAHIRQTMERGGKTFMEMVKRETQYGYCHNCSYKGE